MQDVFFEQIENEGGTVKPHDRIARRDDRSRVQRGIDGRQPSKTIRQRRTKEQTMRRAVKTGSGTPDNCARASNAAKRKRGTVQTLRRKTAGAGSDRLVGTRSYLFLPFRTADRPLQRTPHRTIRFRRGCPTAAAHRSSGPALAAAWAAHAKHGCRYTSGRCTRATRR